MKISFTPFNSKILPKILSLVLIFYFIWPQLIVVFGQELPNDSLEENSVILDEENSIKENGEFIAPEALPKNENEEEVIDDGGEENNNLLGDETEVVDHYRNKFQNNNFTQVDESSGVLQFDLPFTIPPGRNGLQPSISLKYQSKNQNEGSIVGYGWSLSIPYIERLNKRGLDNFFNDSYFTSSLSGELATSTASTTVYMSKIENGDFLQYKFLNNIWKAIDKNGTTYTFGTSTDSRLDNVTNGNIVSKWYLTEIRDTNGNYVKYSYFKDKAVGNSDIYPQLYPTNIIYTGNATTDGIFELEFGLSGDKDYATSSAAGFEVKTRYRVSDITAKINGSWVRKYELEYATSTYRNRALLKKVTESGRDESGTVTTLLPYEFQYNDSSNIGWVEDDSWTLPEPLVDVSGSSAGTNFVEINGDGLPDLIRSYRDVSQNPDLIVEKVYINTGTGWTEDTSGTWVLPHTPYYFSEKGEDRGYRVFDVNGDGLDDILRGTDTALINTGSGWVENSLWHSPVTFTPGSADNGVRIADVNGDGLIDLLYANNSTTSVTFINTGRGWATSTLWASPTKFVDASYRDMGVVIMDINSDGLTDMIRSYKETGNPSVQQQYINNGEGGWQTLAVLPNMGSSDVFIESYKDLGYRFTDADADGQTDIFQYLAETGVDHQMSRLQSGPAWVERMPDWEPPLSFVHKDYWISQGSQFVDFNGDGMIDVIQRDQAGNTHAYVNVNKKVDLLKKVTYPIGGSITIGYETAQRYRDGSGVLYSRVPFPVLTVSTTTISDGLSNFATTSYSYRNGYFHASSTNAFERTFPGFGLVIKTLPNTGITKTYFHNGTTTTATQALGQYDDHISKVAKPYRLEVEDVSSNDYSVTVNNWDKTVLGNNSYFVKLAQTLTMNYDGDSDHKDKAFSYTYGLYGNVSTSTFWGEVTGNNDGSFSDVGADKVVTDKYYASSTALHIWIPSREVVKNQSGTQIAENKYYYDTQALGTVVKGNQTKSEHWKSASSYIDYEKTYDGTYGLVTEEKDPRDKTTTYTYDSYNLYPATSTNPLSQTTVYTYDYSLGKPKETKDVNNLFFQVVYDGLDRIIYEKQPDQATPSTLVNKTTFTYTDNTIPIKVQRTDHLDAATSTNTYSYFDGFGRPIQTRKQAEFSNYAVSDIVYNSLGLKQKESLPYFNSGSAYTSPTSQNFLYNSYIYDPLQRPLTISNNLGTTTVVYDQWVASSTDPDGKHKEIQYDANDRIVSVLDKLSTTTVTFSYEYDGLGNLTKITEQGGALRNFTYDGLGRRLTAEDMHTSSDTSFGTWTYVYDDAGNLISRIDPKNQTVNFSYDDINHVLLSDYAGQTGIEISYIYDSCQYGKGKLCRTSVYNTATTSYMYNPVGLISNASTSISGGSVYMTQTIYDRQGNITSITYPDNSVVSYNYNYAGLPDSIPPYVDNIDYSPLGQVVNIKYGNTASTTNTYDAAKLYRLTNKKTVSGGLAVQNLTYTYSPAGDITQIVDSSGTKTEKTIVYTYDDIHRLSSASTTAATSTGPIGYRQTYAYSPTGNLTYRSDVGAFTYYTGSDTGRIENVHALKNDGSITYNYDFNGNLASTSAGALFTFNFNNQLASTTIGGVSTIYAYDHDGNRIKTTISGVSTYYPNKFYETSSTATTTRYIYAGDTIYATVQTALVQPPIPSPAPVPLPTPFPVTNTFYHHQDHLGSTQVVTATTTAVVELTDYYPYGNLRMDTTTGSYKETHKYIGAEFDSETGLNYLGSRYQNGSIGKFISQDSAFQAVGNPNEIKEKTGLNLEQYLSDPQGMNSYSYARNNPMKLVDKLGDYFETAFDAAMFSLSLNDFRQNPGVGTGLGLAADAVSLVTPIPAIVGGIRHGDDALKLLNKADSVTEALSDTNKAFNGLPDSTVVCRAGTCGADNFAKPGEVKNGLLDGSSVTVGKGIDIKKLTKYFKHNQFGQTTLDKIRALGGDVIPTPSAKNPYHADLNGITPKQAEKLFTPTKRNPNK